MQQSLVSAVLVPSDQANLVAGSGVTGFGTSIALDIDSDLDTDTCLVGASGHAYLFVRRGAVWNQIATLSPYAGDDDSSFGASVALAGGTAVVGAPEHDSNAGAVYVYTRSSKPPNRGTWDEHGFKLTKPGTGRFGTAVAVNDKLLAVGAPWDAQGQVVHAGAVHLFTNDGSTWPDIHLLQDPTPNAQELFGTAVALQETTVLVGAPQDSKIEHNGGAAYLFTQVGTGVGTEWQVAPGISSGASQPEDMFGSAVALTKDYFLIGAPNAALYTGAAYLWPRSGYQQVNPRVLGDGLQSDGASLGLFLALTDAQSLVAGPTADYYAGAAYLWSNRPGTDPEKYVAPGENANFGSAVAMSGNLALVGANGSNDGAGSVFAFALSDGVACSVGADCIHGNCVDGVCCDTACDGTCMNCLAANTATGADGKCGPVTSGLDPREVCPDESSSACGRLGSCNGSGACAFKPEGSSCGQGAATCRSDALEDPADTCDGLGACNERAPAPCRVGYNCARATCPTTCTTDAECDTLHGFSCNVQSCSILAGKTCTTDIECDTGHCSRDQVCCDETCDGACVACTAKNKHNGVDGVCGNVAAGFDPFLRCEPGVQPCGADGQCDGSGRCRLHAPDTQACGATRCSDSTMTGRICNGQGMCQDTSKSCGNFACDGAACFSKCIDNTACIEGTFCNENGQCQLKKADGQPCVNQGECQTHCVVGSSHDFCDKQTDCQCASVPRCSDDRRLALEVNGPKDCGSFNCQDNQCRTTCTSTLEHCAPGRGLACNQITNQCEQLEAQAGPSGCTFAPASNNREPSWLVSGMAGFAYWIRRKRRIWLQNEMRNREKTE